jgi:hypothetical protein
MNRRNVFFDAIQWNALVSHANKLSKNGVKTSVADLIRLAVAEFLKKLREKK